jgi:hypothetical protein
MSRRIEVELTSQRPDGVWTWRAAGAREPKGVLDAALLYEGASVGDVVRADAEFMLDGIEVVSVLPPREKRHEPERLEVIGSGPVEGGVTTSLVSRRGGDRPRRGPRRGDRPDEGDQDRARRPRRDSRDRREGRESRDSRESREGRPEGEGKRGRDRGPTRRPERVEREAPPKPQRLRPGRAHRTAWLNELPDEQKVVAQQLARGGLAAVRKEIEAENSRARDEGRPEVKAESLVELAEQLMPQLRVAEWRDRAEAALAGIDEVDLRDIRSVVVAADDVARSPEDRELAAQLRAGLTNRVDAAQKQWLDEIGTLLAEGRLVRALRVSSRPPKAGAPLPPELAERLTAAANEGLQGEISQQRLAVVLDAAAFSPVRQRVVVETIPAQPDEELLVTIRKVAHQLPEIAARFGVTAPARRPRPPGTGGRSRSQKPAPPPPPPAPPDAATASPALKAAATEDTSPPEDGATGDGAVAEEAGATEEAGAVAEEAAATEEAAAVAEEAAATEEAAVPPPEPEIAPPDTP